MVDFSQIPPMTEAEAEDLFHRNRRVTYSDVDYALNDLPKETGDIVRRYIAQLRRDVEHARQEGYDRGRMVVRDNY